MFSNRFSTVQTNDKPDVTLKKKKKNGGMWSKRNAKNIKEKKRHPVVEHMSGSDIIHPVDANTNPEWAETFSPSVEKKNHA